MADSAGASTAGATAPLACADSAGASAAGATVADVSDGAGPDGVQTEQKSQRRRRRKERRGTPVPPDEMSAEDAVSTGNAPALIKALGGVSLVDAPKPPSGHLPLLHMAARAGYTDVVGVLLKAGADIEVCVQGQRAIDYARAGGHAAVVRVLEDADVRLNNAQAAALLARQREARGLAAEADSRRQAGAELATAVLAARKPALKAAERLVASDRALRLCCAHLADRHRAASSTPPPADVPAHIRCYLETAGAQSLLGELSETLPGCKPADGAISGTQLALAVRVAQLRLREAAAAAISRPLGQDELVPLLEELMIVAAPSHAHTVLARMRKELSDDELLRNPDLAGAVDGWEIACEGVQAQALASYRTALMRHAFFHALSRTPPPNALMMSTCAQKREEPLGVVFDGFLKQLASDEAEAWLVASVSVEGHARSIEALVDEMLPLGDMLYVTFDV